MIEKLIIKNYLIIKDSEIDFSGSLNILTGETGAGKSIILDALSLILGERADYSLIKKDQEKLVVEGHFNFKDNMKVAALLKKLLPDDEQDSDHVILRRELLKKGVSRSFINDTPVNISELKKFGDIIIDIHSQSEHQSLLFKETHIEILDNFINDNELFTKYNSEFKSLNDLIEKYKKLFSEYDQLKEK
ncbi:MAG: AAA family ATPase, partial [Ignavibacteria bacterium]